MNDNNERLHAEFARTRTDRTLGSVDLRRHVSAAVTLAGALLAVFASALFAVALFGSLAHAATPPGAVDAAAENKRCLRCHSDEELATDDGRSMHVHGPDFAASVHGQNACADCHTAARRVNHPRETLGPVGIGACAACHEQEVRVLQSNPHGRKKDGSPADVESCTGCHGAPHEMRSTKDPASDAHVANATETCGTCHRAARKQVMAAAHGTSAIEAGKEVPNCITCHGAHDVQRSPVTIAHRQGLAHECGTCHEQRFRTFHDGFHGKATMIGFQRSATCTDCHGGHSILPASDPNSMVHPDNLAETCGACHAEAAKRPAFLTFSAHIDYTDPNDNFYVFVVWVFMTGLLIGVFGFFGLHMLLWLQRTIVAKLRGELPSHAAHGGPYVKRFSNVQIGVHLTIVLSFLMLAATGLPLKFAGANWAQPLADLLGGAEMAAWWHRVAAIVTFGYFAWHLSGLMYGWFVRKERGYLWGWRSMTPQPKDAMDLWANVKYFLYLGPRPAFDRWTYWEKFDYLAVFWGVAMIGVSGLILWFPGFFSAFLPGWALNAAYIIHSDEALLATGFIFLFHFFHTHIRPESFPMDLVVFTGSQPLARLKDERPLEYQRLVETGQLEMLIVPPPSRARVIASYVFGFAAVAIGVGLAIAIFVGLLSGYGL